MDEWMAQLDKIPLLKAARPVHRPGHRSHQHGVDGPDEAPPAEDDPSGRRAHSQLLQRPPRNPAPLASLGTTIPLQRRALSQYGAAAPQGDGRWLPSRRAAPARQSRARYADRVLVFAERDIKLRLLHEERGRTHAIFPDNQTRGPQDDTVPPPRQGGTLGAKTPFVDWRAPQPSLERARAALPCASQRFEARRTFAHRVAADERGSRGPAEAGRT